MFKDLLDHLICPVCHHQELQIHHISEQYIFETGDTKKTVIETGMLACPQCQAQFPIIESTATLLPADMFTDKEKQFCNAYDSSAQTRTIEHPMLSTEERHEKIKNLLQQYDFYNEACYCDDSSKEWIRNAVEYEVKHAIIKDKYIKSLEHELKNSPKKILDVGGGQAGGLFCFVQHYQPELAVLIDMDDRFTPIAQIRDERIQVIRGDATNMPFKDKVFDLTTSNGCLEHVYEWRKMLAEIKRTGTETYLSYLPNGSFPFEIGHLDTPLVPVIPKSIGRHVSYYWHRMLGNKQYTYDLIDHLLNITWFVPSRKVYKEAKNLGMNPVKMFYPYTLEAAKASYHHTYGKYIKFLGRNPWLLKSFVSFFTFFGIEPIPHFYFYHKD